jgi:hypothetical protein
MTDDDIPTSIRNHIDQLTADRARLEKERDESQGRLATFEPAFDQPEKDNEALKERVATLEVALHEALRWAERHVNHAVAYHAALDNMRAALTPTSSNATPAIPDSEADAALDRLQRLTRKGKKR